MVSSIRINCSNSTYIEKNNPNQSFSNAKRLLTGIVYTNPSNYNIYKTLLKFDTSKLNNHSIQSAFLYLFIEEIDSTSTRSDNIIISKNTATTNPFTINWSNYPKTIPLNKYTLSIATRKVGKYIKINITDLVESWVNTNTNYGLTLEPTDFNYTSIIQLASHNSLKPPYLLLTAICHSQDTEYESDYSMVYCFSSSEKVNDDLATKSDNINLAE